MQTVYILQGLPSGSNTGDEPAPKRQRTDDGGEGAQARYELPNH